MTHTRTPTANRIEKVHYGDPQHDESECDGQAHYGDPRHETGRRDPQEAERVGYEDRLRSDADDDDGRETGDCLATRRDEMVA